MGVFEGVGYDIISGVEVRGMAFFKNGRYRRRRVGIYFRGPSSLSGLCVGAVGNTKTLHWPVAAQALLDSSLRNLQYPSLTETYPLAAP